LAGTIHRQDAGIRDIECHEPSHAGVSGVESGVRGRRSATREGVSRIPEHAMCVLEVKRHELVARGKE
jgi:hypothetical protein